MVAPISLRVAPVMGCDYAATKKHLQVFGLGSNCVAYSVS
ncbi:unnamed protein product [Camellia sinensis]